MARLFRDFLFERGKVDEAKRTVPITFSTETPVDRGIYDEILDHDSVDLSRMDSAPLLLNHDFDKQIGVVEESAIRGKEGKAVVRFGTSALAEEIFKDVKDGIRKQASVGYHRMDAVARSKNAQGRDSIRFSWMPLELTITPVGADPNSVIGRSQPIENDPITKEFMTRNLKADPADGNGNSTATITEVEREKMRGELRVNEQKRFKEITAAADGMGKNFPSEREKFRSMAQAALEKDTTPEDFNAELLHAIPGIVEQKRDMARVGMSEREKSSYSLMRAIRAKMNDEKLGGIEKECHDELYKRSKEIGVAFSANGILVPSDIEVNVGSARRGYSMARIDENGRRDLNVTTAGQGGDFVQTSIVTPIIEILRNKMVTSKLGVQTLSGLQGNIAIPRQTGAATAYSLAESAVLTLSTQTINQVGLTPHRLGTTNIYTKQLLLQSSVDVENFMRDDMMKVMAIMIDNLVLNGTGAASQPTGICQQTGISAVTFGAAATWAKVIAFESALANLNADVGRMAYLVDPATRGTWKSAVKVTGYPSFLWENAVPAAYSGVAPDYGQGTRGPDGMVNGYPAVATNQVLNSKCLFGNFEDAILAMWGGFDVVVNPYTLDTAAEVRITVNTFIDVAIRHAQSFCLSTDSANQ